jgi:hypothetical protein
MELPKAEEQLQIKPTLIGLPLAWADPDAPVVGLPDVGLPDDGLPDVGLLAVLLLLDEQAPAATSTVRAPIMHTSLAGLAPPGDFLNCCRWTRRTSVTPRIFVAGNASRRPASDRTVHLPGVLWRAPDWAAAKN